MELDEDSEIAMRSKRAPFTILFEDRPVLKFVVRYSSIVLLAYPALVAATLSFDGFWFWSKILTPVADILRHVVPIFDNFTRQLTGGGFGSRVEIIHHMLAFGWLVTLPAFITVTFGVITASRAKWIALLRSRPRHWFFFCFLGSAPLFFGMIYWAIFGFQFVSADLLMSWHLYNLPLITMGTMFASVTIFGIAFEGSLGAMIVAHQMGARTHKPQE